MRKLDEIERPTSCLNKASDDEPIFVLRANDENAPGVVRQWAYRYMEEKGGANQMNARELKKYNEALSLAYEMEAWKAENP